MADTAYPGAVQKGTSLKFDDKELRELARRMSALPEELRRNIFYDAVNKHHHLFTARIKDTHLSASPGPSDDLHVGTGRLRSSVFSRLEHGEDEIDVYWGTKVKYARFQEEGTAPHEIRAKAGGVLAWPIGSVIFGSGKKAGQINPRGKAPAAFAKSVFHPGLKARRPFARALEAEDVQREFVEGVAGDTVLAMEAYLQ